MTKGFSNKICYNFDFNYELFDKGYTGSISVLCMKLKMTNDFDYLK